MTNEPIIRSMLDTDLYKFTMQMSVLFGRQFGISYSDVDAEYTFINRNQTSFPSGFAAALQIQVNSMAALRLTLDEYNWLRSNCPFLKRAYLDFLRGYRFDPSEVTIEQYDGSVPGVELTGRLHVLVPHNHLKITIRGPWYKSILWEVPLMSMISELYYRIKNKEPDGGWRDRCLNKAHKLGANEVMTADFGSRRRFSFDVHDQMVQIMKDKCSSFVGTSNIHLAMKHGLKPIGTMAHEWTMFHAALFGYRLANRLSLQAWSDEYRGDLGTALSDTFTTDVFFRDFDKVFANQFTGLRQDSGDPFKFLEKAVAHYQKLGIDPMSKTIVFSDSLNDDKAIRIKKACEGRINAAPAGIGTFLSNDCGHEPLNMVIKLTGVTYGGKSYPCVKLSDVPGKETGDPATIKRCKQELGIS